MLVSTFQKCIEMQVYTSLELVFHAQLRVLTHLYIDVDDIRFVASPGTPSTKMT